MIERRGYVTLLLGTKTVGGIQVRETNSQFGGTLDGKIKFGYFVIVIESGQGMQCVAVHYEGGFIINICLHSSSA